MSTPPKTPLRPFSATQERLARPIIRVMAAVNTWIFRMSGGRVGAKWTHGEPMLLLTTIGRKSGKPRTVPLVYMSDGERLIVVASRAGMSTDPQWVANVEAHPEVEIEIGAGKRTMRARRGSSEEKAHYWPALCRMNSDYADYQSRTTRDIPILVIEPL